MRRSFLALLCLSTAAVAVIYPACSSDTTQVTEETVLKAMRPTADSATMFVGDRVTYDLILTDVDDQRIGGVPIIWQSSNPAVLRYDPASSTPASAQNNTIGSLVAVAKGSATVTGTVTEVKTADGQPMIFTAKITVTGMPASFDVTPRTSSIAVGDTARITASILSADGIPIFGSESNSGNSMIFTVLDAGVAEIVGSPMTDKSVGGSPSGQVTKLVGKRAGSARVRIEAGINGLKMHWDDTVIVNVGSSVQTVTVNPSSYGMRVSQTVQLNATAFDAAGQPIPGAAFQFTSTDPTVATVDRNTGVVTAVSNKGQGSASTVVTAEYGGKSATATITIYPRVAQVVVTPATNQLVESETVQLSASVVLESGVSGSPPAAQFSSDDPTVATVNPTTGLVTAVSAKGKAQETVTIRAGAEGVSGTATVTVRPKPAAATITIETSPAGQSGSIAIGQTRQFVAVVKDQAGAQIPNASVTWTSSNTAVATVSGTGLASGVAAGSATITARSADVTSAAATTTLVVSSQQIPTVHGLEVLPTFVSATVGSSYSFTATVYSVGGIDVTSQVPVTWASSNTAVATVNATGQVNATGIGGALITATAGGQSMSSAISVGATVGSIRVNAFMGSASGDPAWKAELTAYQGTTLVGRGIVSGSGEGYIPGLAPGSYTVTITHPEAATQTFSGVTVVANQVTTMTTVVMQP